MSNNKNCDNNGKATENVKKFFLHNGLLAVQQYSTTWVRVLYLFMQIAS